jgi:hypothetical protein
MIFWTTLLILHGLLALALLGAITHQTVAVWWPVSAPAGVFELKEHLATIGLILLPAYWAYWRQPLSQEYASARRSVTLLLALLVWSNFLIGHIVNNARGMGS